MPIDDKHLRARITFRKDLTPDLWIIRIDPGADFTFAPGQYATLGVERNSRLVERAYSIVSSAYEKELEFFLELVPEGKTTPTLYDFHAGTEVVMRKIAKGHFTLDRSQPSRTNHLLLSTVTGVAPFVSYVRTLFQDWKEGRFSGDHKLFLLNGASRSWEFGYREELESIAREAPWFTCVFTVSRPLEDANWNGEIGRVNDLIRKYADAWGCTAAITVAYLCGHPQMIEQGKGVLHRIGFQKENLKQEVFWIPPGMRFAS
jgi:ferredoxin/flavodoxin---NADP+ reductase